MRSLLGLIGLIGLAWVGCTSSPATVSVPLEVPADFSRSVTGAAGQIDTQWVASLGDSIAIRLVQEALANNPSIGIAAANVAAAEAQARMAGDGGRPQASAGATASRDRRNFIGFPIGGGAGQVQSTTSTSVSANLSATWEVDLWGRLRAGHAAALADVDAAEAEWRAARLSLAALTLKAWFAGLEARQQVRLAQETVESYRISSDQIQARYERGLRPTLDLLLARSSLSAAEANLHQRRRQFDAATRQLEILVGRYPTGQIDVSQRLPNVPGPVPVGLPAELIGRRPDLVAAERRLAASGARVREAQRALYPRISLTASGGRSSNELGDLLDGDFSVWNLIGNVSQPLFQGGRLRAGVDLAQAGVDRALLAYAQSALRAFAEVETGLAAEALLAEQEQSLTAASQESADARRLAEERYLRGLTDLLTLLTAQRNSFDADSRLLAVQRQRLDTRIDLHLALGGDFTVAPDMLAASGDSQ